jgi:hypothetical protein
LFDGATGGQGTPGTPGTPGVSALTVVLSNESFTVPTDSAGNNGNYTGSGTDIYLYEGTNQLTYDGVGTANGTWKIATAATNITASTAFTDQGTYVTVGNHSAMTADTATITYTITGKRADGTAISLTKTQTFSKAKTGATGGQGTPGTPGADAIIGILSKESAVVPTDSAGNNGNFTNVATTLTIYEGGAVSSGWTITQTRSNVTVTEATSSATATVTAISADTGSVTFTATKSGYANVVKTFTVSKSKAGTAGTPGAPAITGILNNESTSVPADNTGTVTSFTGANTTMYIFNGTTDDSANWTVAVSGTPTGIGGSLSGKTYTVTSMTADTGFVDLIATRSGYASITKRFTVTKNKQGLKGDTGSQGNTGARGPESDEALLFGKNSSFYDWAGTLPDGYSGQVGVAPTKVASDNKTSGNSVQWVVAAATNTYMQKNVINVAYSQYVSVEVTFKLTSGTIGGAGVLVRMEATTDADTYIKFVDYVPSPTLNQWYTISEVIKLPSATVPAGYTGYTIFPMGGWTSFGTVDAKTILFDAVKVRPASDGEKYGFENGLLVNGWVATGTVEINGGKVKADTITSREIYVADLSSLSANIGTITAGILKNPSGTTQLNLTTGTFNLGGSALSWNGTTLDINGNIVSDSDNGSRVLRTTIFDGGLQQDWIANDGTYSFDIVIDAWNGIFNTQYTTPAKTVIDKQINISPSLIQFYSNNVANDTSYFGTIQVKGNQTFRRANGGSTGDWIPTLFFDKIDIDMNNNYIQNVNHITFQDGGGSEGIEWLTADNWKIVQAPDDLSNPTDGSGNLQFVRQGVRKATFTSGGNLDLAGNTVSLSGTNGLVSAEAGYLVLRSVAGGIVYAQGLELRATTVNATSFTPVVCQGVITGYTNLYLQVGSTGEVIATSSDRSLWGSTITYRPVRASSFPTGSSVTWKSNVEEFSVEEANFMLDTTPVYTYHLDSNIEQGIYDKPKVGMLAEAVPQKLRDEDGVDPYSIVATLWKVVQGHKKEIAELKAQIADLQLAI